MPWHIQHNASGCPASKPWGVVKDSTGEAVGCHPTKAKAEDHMKALYANDTETGDVVALDDEQSATTDPEELGGNPKPGGKADKRLRRNKSEVEDIDTFAPTVSGMSSDDLEHFSTHLASDAPWDGSPSRFSDAEYQKSAAACDPGDGTVKDRCFLPHHEPGGALNRNGVHAAAGRVGSLKGHDQAAVSRAKSHLRSHYHQLGEDPPPSIAADATSESFDAQVVSTATPQWRGVIVVEGTPTGDGREFAPDSVTWADPPLALQWQKESGHGSDHDVTVHVGSITRVWRDGSNIMGEGNFDLGGPLDDDSHEAYRRMGDEQLNGVSINADDITDSDVEYVFPTGDGAEADDDEVDIISILFGSPEKIIFHAARIRAATLCDIPAFVEAKLGLVDDSETSIAASLSTTIHTTDTSDGPWDGAANEHEVPLKLTLEVARSAYAFVDAFGDRGQGLSREDCRFLHHEIDPDGGVGAANLTACSSGIGVLAGGRGGVKLHADQRRAAYAHLAQHLRDAGQEPPPYETEDALVAHAWHDEWRPPSEWFADPGLTAPTPIIVTDAGRVYGLATEWGVCHLGYQAECILPPREDYHSYYLTGEIPCADGSRVAVGQITAGILHAPLSYGASRASEHYENTEAVVADVVVGNCKAGIWVAGAIRPSASAARVAALRASGQVSPDWRRIGGKMRLVGLLTVNVSGYQVPNVRTYVAGGEMRSMVASGFVTVHQPSISNEDLDRRALQILRDQLVRRVHPEGD